MDDRHFLIEAMYAVFRDDPTVFRKGPQLSIDLAQMTRAILGHPFLVPNGTKRRLEPPRYAVTKNCFFLRKIKQHPGLYEQLKPYMFLYGEARCLNCSMVHYNCRCLKANFEPLGSVEAV